VQEIVPRVTRHRLPHVVLTGGEPMLFAELVPLSEMLEQAGYHVTIETAGTLYLPVRCHLVSISPKLRNSMPQGVSPRWRQRHEQTRHAPHVIRRLVHEYPYQVKFVVGQRRDAAEVETYLADFPEIERHRVWMMPEGTSVEQLRDVATWLVPHCQQQGWRYCARRQIEWFGAVRGT
jgi:7-carboxy-7-deazaguanine synthase